MSPGPIWSSYDYDTPDVRHWPGMYGSVHDAPILDPVEAQAFKEFRALATHHPRYRHLVGADLESEWFPYGQGPHLHRLRPNNRLGNLLARLNAQRIAARIRERGFVDRYPNIAWLWLLQCPQAHSAQVERHIGALWAQHVDPALRHTGSPPLTRMFEHLLSGLAAASWEMRLPGDQSATRFSTGIVDMVYLVTGVLLQRIGGADALLGDFYQRWSSRELYDRFEPGYYAANVEPGGIGAVYTQLATDYDAALARGACASLSSGARAEMRARPAQSSNAGGGVSGHVPDQAIAKQRENR